MQAIIAAFDLLEETCNLTAQESLLQSLATETLQSIIKLYYWKLCSKVRVTVEGDENTKFFHAHTSHRLRKNTIQTLDHEGVEHRSHQSKGDVLHSFYSSLLGSSTRAAWTFDLSSLYPDYVLGLADLSSPFTLDEVCSAF